MAGPAQVDQGIQEHLQAVAVDPADRLVQHQQVRRRLQGQGQQHALQLAPGAAAQGTVRQLRRVHVRQRLPHGFLHLFGHARPHGALRKGGRQEVLHGEGHLPVKLQHLGHIARPQVRDVQPAAVHMADDARMRDLAEEGPDQGRFPGAVLADQYRQLAAVDMHGYILQQHLAAPPDGDPVQVDMAQVTVVKHGKRPPCHSPKFGVL